jgi:hypothetical protein
MGKEWFAALAHRRLIGLIHVRTPRNAAFFLLFSRPGVRFSARMSVHPVTAFPKHRLSLVPSDSNSCYLLYAQVHY